MFRGGRGDPERVALEAPRAQARTPEGRCSADDDCVAEKELEWADAIAAWVCRIAVAAAVVLVLVLAARS
jgi:hypothetical protein